MSDHHDLKPAGPAASQPHPIERSDSSASSSASHDSDDGVIHQPIPMRPRLPSRRSSGPLVVPRDSSDVGPVECHFGPDDVRSMSPRRTSEDIDKIGRAAREEMKRSVIQETACRVTIANTLQTRASPPGLARYHFQPYRSCSRGT